MLGLGLGLGLSAGRASGGDEELPQRYMFVDGAFLRGFVKDVQKKLSDEGFSAPEIKFEHLMNGHERAFFYDAYPEQKRDQTEEEFRTEQESVESLFDRISETPNFNVRPALTKRGNKRQQKGVDILLSIDCLLHATRGNIDHATIITSDLDFFPLFEALQQTKTRTELRYELSRTSRELIRTADRAVPLTAWSYFGWLLQADQLRFRGESLSSKEFEELEVLRTGTVGGTPVEIKHCARRDVFAATVSGSRIGDGNLRSLTLLCGQIEHYRRRPIIWS